MSVPGPLIQIDQLSKRFDKGALAALDSVTAHFNAGEVTGLVGPDAGKEMGVYFDYICSGLGN